MKKQPLVCIVIVNWNGGKIVIDCLTSLFKKTSYSNYKVVLVDNGSSDGSLEEIEKKFKKVKIIKNKENLGFTKATNLGWAYCFKNYNLDYICDMNNDIVTVQSDWLDLMVNTLESNENYGICANKLVDYEGRLQSLFFSEEYPERKEWFNERHSKDLGQYDKVIEVDAVPGGNMLIKRSVIEKVGALDENFFYGPDDIDYCIRTREKGFKIIFNGLSKSIHYGSFSYLSSQSVLIYNHQIYGQMLFAFRHGTIKEKIIMPIRQLLRAFITRKNILRPFGIYNFILQDKFFYRLLVFPKSFFLAISNYKKVKNSYFKLNKNDKK